MLIRAITKRRPQIRLARVAETESGRTWVFTFVDRRYQLMQTVILSKEMPGEAMEASWEQLHEKWTEYLREREWNTF